MSLYPVCHCKQCHCNRLSLYTQVHACQRQLLSQRLREFRIKLSKTQLKREICSVLKYINFWIEWMEEKVVGFGIVFRASAAEALAGAGLLSRLPNLHDRSGEFCV